MLCGHTATAQLRKASFPRRRWRHRPGKWAPRYPGLRTTQHPACSTTTLRPKRTNQNLMVTPNQAPHSFHPLDRSIDLARQALTSTLQRSCTDVSTTFSRCYPCDKREETPANKPRQLTQVRDPTPAFDVHSLFDTRRP